MIIGYFGNVRQGKTYSAVIELYKLYLKGYKIYSNTWLAFDFTPLTNKFILDIIEKEIELPSMCVFFIDEIYMFGLDSRSSMSKKNRVMSWFLLQTGKLGQKDAKGNIETDIGLILLFTSQYPDQIDKRLRHTMDIGVECEKYIHPKTKDKYFIQHVFVYKGSKSFNYNRIHKGEKRYYDLYDTRKRITIQGDPYNQKEIIVSVEG